MPRVLTIPQEEFEQIPEQQDRWRRDTWGSPEYIVFETNGGQWAVYHLEGITPNPDQVTGQ